MNEFIEKPANKNSLSHRKMIYGVGINDSDYITEHKEGNKRVVCPIYSRWKSMLCRCYGDNIKRKAPWYIGCRVCNEWLVFSNFKKWMTSQDWENKELDKDLIVYGNKLYSPDTCVFVTKQVNNLVVDFSGRRGEYPQGVSFNKNIKKFHAYCSSDGKRVNIGFYNTVKEASKKYIAFKRSEILRVSLLQKDPKVKLALVKYLGTCQPLLA